MMNSDNIDHWNLLTQHEQYVFIEKARYLMDRNYIIDPFETLEGLAEKIYLSTLEPKKENGTTDDSGVRGESNEQEGSS